MIIGESLPPQFLNLEQIQKITSKFKELERIWLVQTYNNPIGYKGIDKWEVWYWKDNEEYATKSNTVYSYEEIVNFLKENGVDM